MAEKSKGDKILNRIFWGIGAIFVLYILGYIDLPDFLKKPHDNSISPQWVSAEDLHNEYKSNEVRSDGRYKDKPVIVTGEVKNVEVNLNRPTLVLKAGRYDYVRCHFDKQASTELARLSPGDRVEVKGWGSGLTMGTVNVSDCEFYKR